ncbi:hypothetical protein ACSLVQ_31180, partial [Klebsiella pneumoniae]|uniref:hypothetical protein n=1 Tax=Klebsiella pneumoniae TaxID=573 RepID=UPI003EE1CC9D
IVGMSRDFTDPNFVQGFRFQTYVARDSSVHALDINADGRADFIDFKQHVDPTFFGDRSQYPSCVSLATV